jgi:hypothetical protein
MKLLLFILPVAVSLAWGGVLPRAESTVEFRVAEDSSVVPDRYLVSLEVGHTLEEHWKTIGQNLSKDGEDFRYMEMIDVYVVTLRNANIVHDTIRTDPRVEDVECMSPKLFHLRFHAFFTFRWS